MTHLFLIYISVTQYPGKTNTVSLCRKVKFSFRAIMVCYSWANQIDAFSLCQSRPYGLIFTSVVHFKFSDLSECCEKISSVNSSHYFSSQRRPIRSFSSFCFFPTNLRSRFTNIISCPRIMPPIRRGRRSHVQNMDAAELTDYSVQQLRNLCRQRNIAYSGNKTALLSWLRGSAPQVASLNESVRANNLQGNGRAVPQDHVVNANANDSSFTEGQLNAIQRLVQESISAASREIATT